MTALDGDRVMNLGDTVNISGIYMGTLKEGSVIELWDSLEQTHYMPDPKILAWDNYKIKTIIPSSYDIDPGTKGSFRLRLKENGKVDKVYMRYAIPCPELNEVYTGEYQYPNTQNQPYAFEFTGVDSMYFTSSTDRYPGTYAYTCSSKEMKMDFAGHGVIVTAIRENNALTHFDFIKSAGFDFVSANLNTT